MSFNFFIQIMVLMHVKISSQTLMSHMEELPYYTLIHNIFQTILDGKNAV